MSAKILFIDHSYHANTKSSNFFKDILTTHFTLAVDYIDPDGKGLPLDYEIPKDIDFVVIWQLDHVASYFLNKGFKTIVVPMYDGSANLPNLHWRYLIELGAQFISFSLAIHLKILAHGGSSLLVKYFPEPDTSIKYSFHEYNVFLWQRKPQDGIHVGFVNHIFGQNIKSLHVHLAADNKGQIDQKLYMPPKELLHYPVTTSEWFQESKDLHNLRKNYNVYIAPRCAEGIGLGFLEAMGSGAIVLANNEPTHNEYILSNFNGILFDIKEPQPISIQDPSSISKNALMTVEQGRDNWIDFDVPAIVAFIFNSHHPGSLKIDFAKTFAFLQMSWRAGVEEYEHYLATNTALALENINSDKVINIKNGFKILSKKQIESELSFYDTFPLSSQTTEFIIHESSNEFSSSFILFKVFGLPIADHDQILTFFINEIFCDTVLIKSSQAIWVRLFVPSSLRKAKKWNVKICCEFISFISSESGDMYAGCGIGIVGHFSRDELPLGHYVALHAAVERWVDGNGGNATSVLDSLLDQGVNDPNNTRDDARVDMQSCLNYSCLKCMELRNNSRQQDKDNAQRLKKVPSGNLGIVSISNLFKYITKIHLPNLSLSNESDLSIAWANYFCVLVRDLNLSALLTNDELYDVIEIIDFDKKISFGPLARVYYATYLIREDLQNNFDIASENGYRDFSNWINSYGSKEILLA